MYVPVCFSWYDNYWCFKKTRAAINPVFFQQLAPGSSNTGPTGAYTAALANSNPIPAWYQQNFEFFLPFEPLDFFLGGGYGGWGNQWVGINALAPYNISWSYNGTLTGQNCILWRENSDPGWQDGTHYVCAPPNTPYPDADGILLYHYAVPTLTSYTPNHGTDTRQHAAGWLRMCAELRLTVDVLFFPALPRSHHGRHQHHGEQTLL